jgi:hypothetical protein
VAALTLLLAGALGGAWLAGYGYFLLNGAPPRQIALDTWWLYWQAYGHMPAQRMRLLLAAAVPCISADCCAHHRSWPGCRAHARCMATPAGPASRTSVTRAAMSELIVGRLPPRALPDRTRPAIRPAGRADRQ